MNLSVCRFAHLCASCTTPFFRAVSLFLHFWCRFVWTAHLSVMFVFAGAPLWTGCLVVRRPACLLSSWLLVLRIRWLGLCPWVILSFSPAILEPHWAPGVPGRDHTRRWSTTLVLLLLLISAFLAPRTPAIIYLHRSLCTCSCSHPIAWLPLPSPSSTSSY